MVRKILVCFVTLTCLSLSVLSGHNIDSLQVKDFVVLDTLASGRQDTIAWIKGDAELDKATNRLLNGKEPFKPNPTKAVIYSAIFPGLGQIYNKKYWKLPIIYGGFLGLSYAISWNGRNYNDYSDAYSAIMSDNRFDPAVFAKWQPFLRPGTTINDLDDSQITTLQNSFKRSKDSFRRNRDLSIIGAVALYALCMIDAYVDAQLFDFDISPDLSLKVEPTTMSNSERFSGNSVGIQCSLKF